MGRLIGAAEPAFRRLPCGKKLGGAIFSVCLVAAAWAVARAGLLVSAALHPAVEAVFSVIVLYYTLAARSLADAAGEVYRALKVGSLALARQKVGAIVGRDVDALDRPAIARATVETVGENLVDGVLAPLFYAALGGPAWAVAYKMVNTLDSMIGYRNDAYAEFGMAAARLDDAVNFVPARMAVFFISPAAQLLAGTGSLSLVTALREGRNHTSPNAGYPEAAFAGALGIRLGGPSHYEGRRVPKPFLGKARGEAAAVHIPRACDLMLLATAIGFLTLWSMSMGLHGV
jgi:adenosylcobinamide-phosphate synthase